VVNMRYNTKVTYVLHWGAKIIELGKWKMMPFRNFIGYQIEGKRHGISEVNTAGQSLSIRKRLTKVT